MNQMQLFTNHQILASVNRSFLQRFLEDMKHCLTPEAAALLGPKVSHEDFCAGLATLFRSPGALGAPLLQALSDIETLALPENSSLLDDALSHLPRGFEINRNFPSLHQSLHLWIIAQNTSGVTFPISSPPTSPITLSPTLSQPSADSSSSSSESSSSSFSSSSSPAAPKQSEGGSSTPAFSEPPIENQKSKIENSSAPQQSINPSIHQSNPITPLHQDPSPASPIENPKSKIENSSSLSKSDFLQILERLSKLSPLDYELARHAEAKRLHLRLRALDDAVDELRSREADAQANNAGLSQLNPWPEPILDGPALFDEVHDRYLLYFYLPPGAAVVLTLWPSHANAIRAFTQTPRINLTSNEPGCGKSTVLSFLATLCPKVLRTDNLKTAVLFRIVERYQPTLLLDEVDSYLHLYPDLRGLLNAGHDPDACVHRCEGNHVRVFKSFAATALAGLGHLSPTLRDRSIIIPMTKAPPGSLQARFDKRKLDAENILGQKIARWTQDNFAAIAACDPPIPTYNRLADNWRPLFAVAHVIGGHWPQRILDAFHSLTSLAKATGDGSARSLLADIRTVFAQSGSESLFSSALVDSLCALPGRPWTTINRNKPITEIWLARRLRSFGIASHPLRINGARANGYILADFTQTFATLLDGKPSSSQPPRFRLRTHDAWTQDSRPSDSGL